MSSKGAESVGWQASHPYRDQMCYPLNLKSYRQMLQPEKQWKETKRPDWICGASLELDLIQLVFCLWRGFQLNKPRSFSSWKRLASHPHHFSKDSINSAWRQKHVIAKNKSRLCCFHFKSFPCCYNSSIYYAQNHIVFSCIIMLIY